MTISATTRGLRPGVCTSTSRPGSPFDGQLIYETDTNRVAVYDTNTWVYKTPASTTGSVLRVVSTIKTDTFSTTSTTLTDITGLSATITPSATSSLVLIHFSVNIDTPQTSGVAIVRGSTKIGAGATAGNRTTSTTYTITGLANRPNTQSSLFLDSPATTSATTYKLQTYTSTGTTWVNRTADDIDTAVYPRGASTITLMEIAG